MFSHTGPEHPALQNIDCAFAVANQVSVFKTKEQHVFGVARIPNSLHKLTNFGFQDLQGVDEFVIIREISKEMKEQRKRQGTAPPAHTSTHTYTELHTCIYIYTFTHTHTHTQREKGRGSVHRPSRSHWEHTHLLPVHEVGSQEVVALQGV